MQSSERSMRRREWPTWGLLASCYLCWAVGTTWIYTFSAPAGFVLTTLAIALHSSLTHELIHGHPLQNPRLNEALAFPCLGVFIPYQRFRDQHLAHHTDARLTDPYDDPESNYLDPQVWDGLPRWHQRVLTMNNTLLGRMLLGPGIGLVAFVRDDLRLARAGDRAVQRAWLVHVPAVALVLLWVVASPMPLWLYVCACYLALSLLKIRTFLEHQAHALARGRTVIIEDRGPLSWLFLNNNLHVVHHMHPQVAWYDLPALYRLRKDRFQSYNEGYVYPSYGAVFRQHLIRAKDPVPHPLWQRKD